MNIRNHGIAIGNLAKNPILFNNKDESAGVAITLAVQDSYTSRDGKKMTQFLSFEGFIRKENMAKNVYQYMHEGDRVGIEYSLRSRQYEKNGEKVYTQVAFIETVDLMDSKSVTEARAKKKAEQNAANAPAEAPSPATEPEPAPEDRPFN